MPSMATDPAALFAVIRRAAGGDAAAIDQVVRDLYPDVRDLVHRELERDFRRSHRWMLPIFSTGDIVQDVFLGTLKALPTFELRDLEGLRGWLAVQVKNRILDTVRRHESLRRDRRKDVALGESTGEGPMLVDQEPSPSCSAELGELLHGFEGVVAELSDRERRLIELRLHDERSWREVAAELQFPSEEAARFAFRYLKARLLVKLQRMGLVARTQDESESAP
jgi:RNA polymerase sigma factor (sigma-70 family)